MLTDEHDERIEQVDQTMNIYRDTKVAPPLAIVTTSIIKIITRFAGDSYYREQGLAPKNICMM